MLKDVLLCILRLAKEPDREINVVMIVGSSSLGDFLAQCQNDFGEEQKKRREAVKTVTGLLDGSKRHGTRLRNQQINSARDLP